MKRETICFEYADARAQLIPRLRGRSFHVTCGLNLEPIVRASAILANENGELATTFGSSGNSFFRNGGCVSVFDYRDIGDAELEDTLMRCSPWQSADKCGDQLAFLFLRETARDGLRSWMDWKAERALAELVVPYARLEMPGQSRLLRLRRYSKCRSRVTQSTHFSPRCERPPRR